jgi:hypothetical protein
LIKVALASAYRFPPPAWRGIDVGTSAVNAAMTGVLPEQSLGAVRYQSAALTGSVRVAAAAKDKAKDATLLNTGLRKIDAMRHLAGGWSTYQYYR